MGETATTYSDLTIVTSDNPRCEDPLAIIGEIEAGIDQRKIRKYHGSIWYLLDDAHTYTVIADRKAAIIAAHSDSATSGHCSDCR